MRIFSVLILLLWPIVAGCSDEQTQTKDKESFPTEEAALTHFIENESPRDDIERVQTSQGSELFIVRSGNHQYSVYGKANENDEHSVEKLTATLSLHNTNSGGAEFTSSRGEEYTFLVAKKQEGLATTTKPQNEFHPIFSDDAFLALSSGHNLDKAQSGEATNVIQATETLQDDSSR